MFYDKFGPWILKIKEVAWVQLLDVQRSEWKHRLKLYLAKLS